VIFVDSGIWIDYFNGTATPQTDYLHDILGRRLVCTGDLVLVEVLQGFDRDRDVEQARRLMSLVEMITVSSPEIALQAAANYRTLRAKGITVRKTIDTLIATRCIADDIALLYSDRDFDAFAEHLGLRSALAA